MKEIPGGLFDKSKTGGHSGISWSAFKLSEPMPNPVLEEPIRRLLGLTGKKFESILAGQEELQGFGKGPSAIKAALENINLDKEIENQRAIIRAGRVSYRDAAIKKLGLLKSAKQLGVHPSEYMLTKVPVLPPMFRPVAMMSNDMPLVDDANHLYKELFEANKNLARVSSLLGPDESSEERLAVYNAFKAVTGLGDPIGVKNQEQGVKGILATVFASSPKYSVLQRKLISTTVDNVGRGVISPNPTFDMDTIGIPENSAFKIYDRPVTRRLVRRGMSMMAARQEIENRSKLAKDALLEEMEERPVLASRAPVLHKYGIMAFRPKLVKSNTLEVSPLIVKPYGADHDGDAMNFHVPATKQAVEEAYERLLPSKNLFKLSDMRSVAYSPANEYVAGLRHATKSRSDRPVRVFRNISEVREAFAKNTVDVDDPIQILEQ
jgi:DNA-directed RNA polymerase subunit beta'